jgi:hypothetical protein
MGMKVKKRMDTCSLILLTPVVCELQGANRTLLHWLKLWDKVVFGRERKVKHRNKDEGKKESRKGESGLEGH